MKKIAVVEDNPDNRLLVQVILESLYKVVEYENGFTALAGLPKEKPDVVLLDISLPEMDGAEVLRRMRADPQLRMLPVIALTAHAMSGDREKFLAAGFNDYVTKPIVDENVLLDAIQRLLPGERPVEASTRHEPSDFNPDAIERLLKLGGTKFTLEMMEMFSSYGATKLADARKAQQAGDLNALAEAAHPLKSSAGNVGVTGVQELAAQVESSARDRQAELAGAQLDQLERAFAAALLFLDSEKVRLTKPPS